MKLGRGPVGQFLKAAILALVMRAFPPFRIGILGGGLEFDEGAWRLAGADQRDIGAAHAGLGVFRRDGEFGDGREQREEIGDEFLKVWSKRGFGGGRISAQQFANPAGIVLEVVLRGCCHALGIANREAAVMAKVVSSWRPSPPFLRRGQCQPVGHVGGFAGGSGFGFGL